MCRISKEIKLVSHNFRSKSAKTKFFRSFRLISTRVAQLRDVYMKKGREHRKNNSLVLLNFILEVKMSRMRKVGRGKKFSRFLVLSGPESVATDYFYRVWPDFFPPEAILTRQSRIIYVYLPDKNRRVIHVYRTRSNARWVFTTIVKGIRDAMNFSCSRFFERWNFSVIHLRFGPRLFGDWREKRARRSEPFAKCPEKLESAVLRVKFNCHRLFCRRS